MNKQRKMVVAELVGRLVEIQNELQEILDEEDTCRDNMPGNLHESEQYLNSEAASDYMGSALDDIQNTLDELQEITGE